MKAYFHLSPKFILNSPSPSPFQNCEIDWAQYFVFEREENFDFRKSTRKNVRLTNTFFLEKCCLTLQQLGEK